MLDGMKNSELLAEMDRLVVGHAQAKKYLINLINRSRTRSYLKYQLKEKRDNLITPGKLLLIGESGTGKTFLVQTLQKLIGFPLLYIDGTRITPMGAGEGIKIADLKTMINNTVQEYLAINPHSYAHISQGVDETIVFIDEIDKIAFEWESSGNWQRKVQASFLTLFEQTSIDSALSGVTFILAGAFHGLAGKKEARKTKIGFNAESENDCQVKAVQDEDLVKFGLIPEFVGRISGIVELDYFTKDDYENILRYTILPKKIKELEKMGIYNATVPTTEINKIVEKAVNSGQGVRALKRGLELYFVDLEFDYENYIIDFDSVNELIDQNSTTVEERERELLRDDINLLEYIDDEPDIE